MLSAFSDYISPVKSNAPNSALIGLLAALAARAIVKQVSAKGGSVSKRGRFQIFSVFDKGRFHLVGRVNSVSYPDDLDIRSELYRVDPDTKEAEIISSTGNIAKNNSFTTLITLPMSDFYKL